MSRSLTLIWSYRCFGGIGSFALLCCRRRRRACKHYTHSHSPPSPAHTRVASCTIRGSTVHYPIAGVLRIRSSSPLAHSQPTKPERIVTNRTGNQKRRRRFRACSQDVGCDQYRDFYRTPPRTQSHHLDPYSLPKKGNVVGCHLHTSTHTAGAGSNTTPQVPPSPRRNCEFEVLQAPCTDLPRCGVGLRQCHVWLHQRSIDDRLGLRSLILHVRESF